MVEHTCYPYSEVKARRSKFQGRPGQPELQESLLLTQSLTLTQLTHHVDYLSHKMIQFVTDKLLLNNWGRKCFSIVLFQSQLK